MILSDIYEVWNSGLIKHKLKNKIPFVGKGLLPVLLMEELG